jgi:hypothetical protein
MNEDFQTAAVEAKRELLHRALQSLDQSTLVELQRMNENGSLAAKFGEALELAKLLRTFDTDISGMIVELTHDFQKYGDGFFRTVKTGETHGQR